MEAAGALGAATHRGRFHDDFIQSTRTTPLRGFGIDSRIGAAALRAPAASMEDSRPQAILKFQPRSSFDYRVRHELQLGSK